MKRNIETALFVYPLRITKQLIKVLFTDKAFLTGLGQFGLFRCRIQRRFYDTRSDADTGINGCNGHRRIDPLGAFLAPLAQLRIARESRADAWHDGADA